MVDEGAWAMEQNIRSGDCRLFLRWRRDFLNFTTHISFIHTCSARLSSNLPALTRLLDDHSISESPVQIGVLQQLILCWLLRPDIWLGDRDDVIKLTTAEYG